MTTHTHGCKQTCTCPCSDCVNRWWYVHPLGQAIAVLGPGVAR